MPVVGISFEYRRIEGKLPFSAEPWDCRDAPPHLSYVVLGMEPGDSCLLGKNPTELHSQPKSGGAHEYLLVLRL